MPFTRLDKKWTKPRVAVLDDSPNEVEALIRHLRAANYEVSPFTAAQDFVNAVRTRVFPIQLIDVSLSKTLPNADGLRVAHDCAEMNPEALRICISAVLSDMSVNQIIEALNPRYIPDLAMSLSASLGVRDIWGIYNKTNKSEVLRDIIEGFRATIACGDETEIFIDDALAADFADSFQGIRWDESGVLIEPQVQVVEIVRQLARRPGMPPVRKVTLTKLGKGRSKTVVAHMCIEFQGPRDTKLDDALPKSRQSIIKIGRFASIQREILHYTTVLPYIFGATFYPNIEATGLCRNLAGVSYSCLSDGDQDVAPTLLEALYGEVDHLTEDDALGALGRAFEFKRRQSVSRAAATREGEHLLNAYMQRFSELPKSSTPIGTLASAHISPLTVTLRAANQLLHDTGALTTTGSGQAFLNLRSIQVPVAQTVEQLTRPFALWEDFWVGLEHGDLHLDNILLIRQGATWSNFYIDFADAGQHHAMLDFVVMEVAIRFQSMKYLPAKIDEVNKPTLLRALCSLEDALLAKNIADWSPGENLPPELMVWTQKTWKIAREIRRQALLFLDGGLRLSIQEALSREGQPTPAMLEEELSCEHQRFLCGIGLAALAAMHLPQPTYVEKLHKAWFAFVGQAYLTIFNQWKTSRM